MYIIKLFFNNNDFGYGLTTHIFLFETSDNISPALKGLTHTLKILRIMQSNLILMNGDQLYLFGTKFTT
jgi:hypothetical protein